MVFNDFENNLVQIEQRNNHSKVVNILATFFLLPESKVLLEEFDNGLGVSEVFLRDFVNLLKCLLKVLLC